MQSAKLDRTITVQRMTQTVAPSGAVSNAWTNLATFRAEARDLTADEVATGFGSAEQGTVVFVVRWHPAPITTGDRILYEGQTFDLKQIAEIGRRKGWKLRAVAVS